MEKQKVYDFLESLGIAYDRIDHDPALTMEVCQSINAAFSRLPLAEFLALPEEQRAGLAVVSKNLFLTNKQHSRHILLIMPGDKKFLTKNLSAQIQSARLSFATDDELLELLDLTPGSVSIVGLMNDPERRVELVIDRDVLRGDHIAFHPGHCTSSVRITTADFTDRLIPALAHTPTIVTL